MANQRCEICKVEIESVEGLPDRVHFSNGPAGSRSKLWSRVCRFINNPEKQKLCLNQNADLRGPEQQGDAFPDPPSMDLDANKA